MERYSSNLVKYYGVEEYPSSNFGKLAVHKSPRVSWWSRDSPDQNSLFGTAQLTGEEENICEYGGGSSSFPIHLLEQINQGNEKGLQLD